MKLVNKSGDTILLEITEDARAEVLHNFINSYEHYDSPETRERLFIYSIVNTLTQIPNVDSVLFVNEKGKAAQSFININLGMPLYPNPGLEAD